MRESAIRTVRQAAKFFLKWLTASEPIRIIRDVHVRRRGWFCRLRQAGPPEDSFSPTCSLTIRIVVHKPARECEARCYFPSRPAGIESSPGDQFVLVDLLSLRLRTWPARLGPSGITGPGFFGSLEKQKIEGFDPGSERTLAAWIRHASRGRLGATPVDRRKG